MQSVAVTAPADLADWAAAISPELVASDGLTVDLDAVAFETSTRAKRRAGACTYQRPSDAAVGTPIDDPPSVEIRLTWAAWEELGVDAMRDVLRHELLHAEQVQAYGTTTHGPAFEARADELGVPLTCERFAAPNYRLTCTACDAVVAERYRRSKLVSQSEKYRSSCCQAGIDVETCQR
ncbi:SprT-like domain-containing protein [Halocalculus aciditolerans]|uniref:SprT-like domain-containing protein n=1 Tax=Halocalculus aciditolerans TaxID=1383812 RepID=A0A830FB76_9EURY|nr:SprT-like domain-containing protein [Halocalculus aciditolerans]GGL57177.1 hypothetical protein GCM10009039_14200 [Halocalculus aciditolerans]